MLESTKSSYFFKFTFHLFFGKSNHRKTGSFVGDQKCKQDQSSLSRVSIIAAIYVLPGTDRLPRNYQSRHM